MALNVANCIKLHNSIVAHACDQLPQEYQPRIQQNWFDVHNLTPHNTNLDIELSDDVKTFLKGINIVLPKNRQRLAFNPLLVGIASPGEMRPDELALQDENNNLILLYRAPGPDPGGLVMSLEASQVCYMPDMYTDITTCLFGDLEDVLERYLHCCTVSGKFVVDSEHPGFGDSLATQGWRVEECTDIEFQATLDHWNELVDTVISKMPTQRGGQLESREAEVLISSSVLEQYPAIPPFARAFLSKARKPPFSMIAPHLQVPDEAFIHRVGAQLTERHPNASLATPQHKIEDCPAFLLFPWATPGVQLISRRDRDVWQNARRPLVLDNRYGLYIVPDIAHSHASRILLPFQLGKDRHIKSPFDEGGNVAKPGQDVIFQHGQCDPFFPGHGTPVAGILATWTTQITQGEWSVGKNGVVGSEDEWRKADTAAHAHGFSTEWTCV